MDAVEAEGAIHISQLAGAGRRGAIRNPGFPPCRECIPWSDNYYRHCAIHDFHLERRHKRLYEVELPDRDKRICRKQRFRREQAVNDERPGQVTDCNPGGPPGAVPQAEGLISPQKQHHEELLASHLFHDHCGQLAGPAATNGLRPASAATNGHAMQKKLPAAKEAQDQQAPPMNPGQHPGQVHRVRLAVRAKLVQDQDARKGHHRHLQRQPGMPPSEKPAQQWYTQQVESRRPGSDAGSGNRVR